MNMLEKVSHEIMVFMRGKYRLDEIGDGKDELKFKQGQKTILTIYIHEDKFTFLIIFGKKERESFEAQKDTFSKYICDLCVHYTGITDEQRVVMVENLVKMWDISDWSMRCEGCYSENCYCKDDPCNAKGCAPGKGLSECKECSEFPCIKATSADYRSMIHTGVHYADEITWGILPYVPRQYEE